MDTKYTPVRIERMEAAIRSAIQQLRHPDAYVETYRQVADLLEAALPVDVAPCPYRQCSGPGQPLVHDNRGPVGPDRGGHSGKINYWVQCTACGARGPVAPSPQKAGAAWAERV